MKTLMENMTTSAETDPFVYQSSSSAAPPINATPLCMVSRSDSAENLWGSHESTAMFAMTLGPSMKPVCAPTSRSAASERSVRSANPPPAGNAAKTFSARAAFKVCPSAGETPAST